MPRLPSADSPATSILIGAGAGAVPLLLMRAGFDAGFDPASAVFTVLSTTDGVSLWDTMRSTMPGFPHSPLALISLGVDRTLASSIPSITALLNLLIHVLNCVLFHRFALSQQPRDPLAAVVASVFLAASPAALPYVFMASHRAPLLALLFLLGSLLLSARHADRGIPAWRLILSCLSYAAALFSCAWTLLALPMLLWRTRGAARSSILPSLTYVLIAATWVWAVLPEGNVRSTVRPASDWTPMSLIMAFVPYAHDLPRGDLQLFLGIAVLVLLGLAMPGIHRSVPSMMPGLLWLSPLLIAAPSEYPDPVGLAMQNAYIFLPGAAIFVGAAVSIAFDGKSREMRIFAAVLSLTTLVVFMNLASIYAVRVAYRTGRVYEKLDRIAQEADRNKVTGGIVLVQSLVADPVPFTDDCDPYLDLIHRCRTGRLEQRIWLVASPKSSWLWSDPPAAEGLKTQKVGRTQLLHAAVSDASDLITQPHVALQGATDQRAFSVETRLSGSLNGDLSGRYPEWTADLVDWQAGDATLEPRAGSARVASGVVDPSLISPAFSWPAYLVGELRVEMKLIERGETDALRFYFESGFAPGFSEARALNVELSPKKDDAAGSSVTIGVPLSDDLRWIASGRLTRIRLDPPRGSIIELRAVRLLPLHEDGDGELGEWPSEWRELSFENAQGGSMDRVEGTNCYRATTEDPWIATGASIDPRQHDLLRVTMSFDAPMTGGESRLLGKVYWRSTGQPKYLEERSLTFPIQSGGEVRTYVIDLNRHFDWFAGGSVDGIRIDPFPGMGTFCLSRVELGSSRKGLIAGSR